MEDLGLDPKLVDKSLDFKKVNDNKKKLYAALDLGTNSCRMLIARPTGSRFEIVDAFSKSIRLGLDLERTGEEERLESILPLVKKYNVPVVAISNDDTGISEDPEIRFKVAKKIVERASDFGIPANDIIVDPLVMPIGAMPTAGQQVFELVKKLKEELKVNTTCGASNISFGLPNRHSINSTFLPMAIASGMSSAIMNPTNPDELNAIYAANLLMNRDKNGSNWIKRNRVNTQKINIEQNNGENQEGNRIRRRNRRRS